MRLLILAAVITIAYGHSACPPLWTNFAGNCYRFFPDRLQWTDAKTTCGQFAPCSAIALGQLVKLATIQDNEFLKIYVNSFVAQPPAIDIWMGASDIALERSWVWGDGTPVTYANWGISQPDNGATSTGQPENCAMYSGETGQWFDASCAMMMPYMCMMPAEQERPMFPGMHPPYQPTNPNQPGTPINPNNPINPNRPI